MTIPFGILFVIITFFSTMGGGIFTVRQGRLDIRFFFAAGALLGISFFDLLPEAISIATANSLSIDVLMVVLVIAFLLFHVLDRFIVLHALKDGHPEHGLESSGPIKAAWPFSTQLSRRSGDRGSLSRRLQVGANRCSGCGLP